VTEFARCIINHYPPDVWPSKIAFYLDGISFIYTSNSMDQAHAPHGRIWQKAGEGLKQGCLAKGNKAGTGGKLVKMIVAISYNKGVIICKQYDRMCGTFLRLSSMNTSSPCFKQQKKEEVECS